ncbi:ATP-binding cassette subfamily B protein [Clavibacter michiganensis]|uniref:ABC transporter ATP-binding protein n=1 Tax=Clavibacter michiganensis TaxID=28447 RepID=UPI001D620BDF|nr:ABC transporter ATP-binding protein [Clavibacter michiganensis]MBP2459067.1 ATP-binding cassette subfamily B protein [Clavibacter michiganensis]MDQ0411639.1 ATP-binding cassette subfamily B protein [Clavibacter michiganensis]
MNPEPSHADPETDAIEAEHPLRSALRPSTGRLVIAAIAFAIKDSPLWILPLVTAAVVDALVEGRPPSALIAPAIIGAATIAVNVAANGIFVRMFSSAIRSMGARLREALAIRLQLLSFGYRARGSASIVQTKIVRDVENLELMFQQAFGPVLNAVVILIGAGTATALRVPQFLPVLALTLPLAAGLILWLRSRTANSNETFRVDVESMSATVGEMSSLQEVTRAHGLERVSLRRVVDAAHRVEQAGVRLDRLNGRFGALSWSSYQLITLGSLFGAAAATMTGTLAISVGEVVLLSSYFALLTGAITSAFQTAPLITRGLASRRSIAGVLTDPDVEQNEGRTMVDALMGGIDFDGVSFDHGDQRVLTDITLEIAPGETVAFVGASGSGKSTLTRLVLGFLRPTEGRVLLDGRDITTLDMRTVRRFVSVVPQESVLFRGSIRDNILYGTSDPDDERLTAALRAANAGFVFALPDGWDTTVGERGAQLSGGQRQRLAIARALIRDPRLLILDEATAALDPHSEAEVRTALERLREGRTTLIVAHRLSTVRTADRIVVLDAGRVVESRTHDELMAAGGRYAEMNATL